jgi:hypothetical protein
MAKNDSYAGQLIDEIERLKKQIEKMKNCNNCKNMVYDEDNGEYYCKAYDKGNTRYCIHDEYLTVFADDVEEKWEMKE